MSQSESSKRRAKHKAMGLCTECKEKAFDGHVLCKRHHEMRLEYERKRYHRIVPDKRERGVCVYNGCHCEAVGGESYCGYHQELTTEKQARFQMRNMSKGLCRCGRSIRPGNSRYGTPYKQCESCYQAHRRYDMTLRETRRQARLAAMEAQDV